MSEGMGYSFQNCLNFRTFPRKHFQKLVDNILIEEYSLKTILLWFI